MTAPSRFKRRLPPPRIPPRTSRRENAFIDLTDQDRGQIQLLEKQITSLLDISLNRLKQQLAVLDAAAPDPATGVKKKMVPEGQ